MNIKQKVDHVKRAKHTRAHTCHWPGCGRKVKPALWGCSVHWFALPKNLRDEVWRTYRPGQEESGDPSEAYIEVAQRVQAWIREEQRRKEDLPHYGHDDE